MTWDLWVVALVVACLAGLPAVATGQPASLKTVRIPRPDNLATFVRNEGAAIALGKAFFWDMQVGSDGIQACASCHFHAGADNRLKNQINPGTMHQATQFEVVGPNGTLKASDFPFHRLSNPDLRSSTVLSDSDDVVSSQGVFRANFRDVVPGRAEDLCDPVFDAVWNVGGKNVRRVEPRNTPTVINAVFNFRNFWDGRASVRFNGVNPFGPRDPSARVLQLQANGSVVPVAVSINRASLASQAVAPLVSATEMSCEGRTIPKLGKKLLSLTPLAKQLVDPTDSILGVMANSAIAPGTPGLRVSYTALIQEAFQPQWWNSNRIVTFSGGVPVVTSQTGVPQTTDQFTLMEANFSLFWGLAVQLYESMLVSDDTPFDRFQEGVTSALTPQQQQGLQLFLDRDTVRCINHHRTSLFTGAAFPANPDLGGEEPIQLMGMPVGTANYDGGFYNLGVRPTTDDAGVGGEAPPGQPLSFSRRVQRQLDVSELAGVFTPDPIAPGDLVVVDGSTKVPGLRNVELTLPYMRIGGMFSLEHVVDFYARGGDFTEANFPDIDPDMTEITGLDTPAKKAAMVAFLKSLTDDRVRFEDPPFDHPQLFVPNGHPGDATAVVDDGTGKAADELLEIAAVGALGRCVGIDGRTRPCCGDSIIQAGEQCDGNTDAACPGQCQPDCFCLGRAPVIGELLADAAVLSGSPNTNFGTATVLQADASSAKQSFFRVRVRGVGARRVTSAVLRLQVADVASAASPSGGRIHPIASCGWDERTVTWNTRPPIDGPALATAGAVARNQTVDFNVTAAIPGDGVYCFGLDNLSADNVQYNSREAPAGRSTLTVVAAGATRCGDNVVDPGEQCDGTAAAACPGACRADCTCPPRCGDGQVNQLSEECDGATDPACPGRCQADCRCGTPPATTPLDLAPVADTYIEKGTEATWDHGAAPHVDVDLSPRGIAYLKFDLSGVAAPVARATLTLHCINTAADGGTLRVVPDSSWIEGTGNGVDVSSANGPGLKWVDVDTNRDGVIDAADTSPYVPDLSRTVAVLGRVVAGQDHTVDVTSAFQGGPRLYTLAIPNNDTDGATYSSRTATTAAFRPRLHLELATGSSSTTTTLPGGGTTTTLATTTTTTTTAASTTTTTLPPATTLDLPPAADTYIEAGVEATWDHGAAGHMDVDFKPLGITYLRFDLRGLTSGIISAVLTLTCTNASSDGGTVYPVADSSWVEGDRTGVDATSANGPGLKWNDVDTNRDGFVDARDASAFVPDFTRPAAALGAVFSGQQRSVDVTAALQGGPGLYTLAIRGASSDGATYASRRDATAARRPVLRVTVASAPSACASAVVIPPGGGTFGGTTSGASSLDGSCGGLGSPERVLRWTPAVSGTATIRTCSPATTFDTVVYLRQGSCEGSTQVACNDDTLGCGTGDGSDNAPDHGSSITTAVTAGTPYFIVVDGFDGANGDFTLTVVPPS